MTIDLDVTNVDNVKDTADLPQYVKDALTLVLASSLDQVIARALLDARSVDQTGADARAGILRREVLKGAEDQNADE
jgi:hypothetical protein